MKHRKSPQLHVTIRKDQLRWLRGIARNRKETLSGAVRHLIDWYLKQENP